MVRWMALVAAAWVAFHILFFSEPRFHIPLLPLAALLAALGIEAIRSWVEADPQANRTRRRKDRKLALASGRRGARRR
jgi:MFS superfamily sulfate permease-like transporter